MPHGRTLRSLTRASLIVLATLATATACSEIVTQVGEEDVVSVRVSPDSALVRIARTLQLRALPLDATGALIAGQTTTWSSVNTAVATVDETGLVTGVSTGTTEIVARVAGLDASASITVTPPPAIALSEDSVGFSTTAGGADPAPDSVQITNGGASDLTGLAIDSIVYSTGASGWLTAQLSASTAPSSLVFTPDPTGLTTAGVYVATVWVSGVDADNSPAPVTVTLEVTAGAASSVTINDGDAQTASAGSAVATAPSVLVADAFGNPVASVSVTFAVTGGAGTVGGPVQGTDANGIARVGSWTLGTTAGANTLDATVVTVGSVRFTATGTAGAATKLQINDGDGQAAVAGSEVAVPPSVIALDEFDNGVAGVAVTFEVASGGGSITGASQTTGADGVATVGSWTLGTSAGTNTLLVTAPGIADSVTVTATALTGAAVAMMLEAGDNQIDTVAATLPVAYAVKVVDSFGNGVEGVPVSWSVTGGGGSVGTSSTTDANGIATTNRVLGTTVGAHMAEGAVGGLTGSPVEFDATAVAGAPTTLTVTQGDGQTETVGTAVSVAPQVSVTDQFSNPIAGHSVTFAVTAGGGTVDPTSPIFTAADGTATATSWTLGTGAGTSNNTLTATATGGLTGSPGTFTASADPDAPAAIAIQSGDAQSAITGNNVSNPPSALVTDQYGNGVPGVTVDFSPSGGGSVGTPSATTNASGVAMSTWTVSVTGVSMGTDGTYANSLDATVQGTAFTTQFSGFAIYSYGTHVDGIWANCTGCHGGTSGLTFGGDPAANYTAVVNFDPVCDATLSASYRRISPVGGTSAATDLSVLMRLVDPTALGAIGTCGDFGHPQGLSAGDLEILRAWTRNGAPNN